MNKSLMRWCRLAGRLRNVAFMVALVTGLSLWPCNHSGLVSRAIAAGEDAALASRLDAVLDKALAQQKIVGAVVVAARNGHVVYQRAVGMADQENGTAMSLDTRFRLASMSKPIVSAAALALADHGLIGLDDPVTRWIPFFTPAFQGKVDPVITIRHLLTHTAGLSYGFLEPANGPMAQAEVSDGLDNPPITLDENIWRLASVPLYDEPGTGRR